MATMTVPGRNVPTKGIAEVNVDLIINDIPLSFVQECRLAGVVCCDIETTGLDWKVNQMKSLQLFIPGSQNVTVVRFMTPPQSTPNTTCWYHHPGAYPSPKHTSNIGQLMTDPKIVKVFHHALFDLRYLSRDLNIFPASVVCTKIAAKLAQKGTNKSTSLRNLLSSFLGVEIDKTEQTSDWSAEILTESQIRYAVSDVLYLKLLLDCLQNELEAKGLWDIAIGCFAHLPARAWLDLNQYTDIFEY